MMMNVSTLKGITHLLIMGVVAVKGLLLMLPFHDENTSALQKTPKIFMY
jgi:hypothetical protein